MEETRKFLRYITPGLIFVVETTLLLWLIFPMDVKTLIQSLQEDKSLGLVLALLLASGGLGFIFSIIHHLAYWRIRFYPRHDFTRWKVLEARLPLTKTPEFTEPSTDSPPLCFFILIRKAILADDYNQRRQRWVEITALWYKKADGSQINKNTHDRANSLADLVHSTGTAYVASLVSIFVAVLIVCFNSYFNLRDWIAIRNSVLSLLWRFPFFSCTF